MWESGGNNRTYPSHMGSVVAKLLPVLQDRLHGMSSVATTQDRLHGMSSVATICRT